MRKRCIIVTGIFCTLLFTTCKQYYADLEDHLSYWSAVVTARGVTCNQQSQINTSGVQCIPSATDVAFTFKVHNPKNFTLVTPRSSADAGRVIRFPHLSSQPVYGTEYTLRQTASDTLTLVYKSAFLKAHEWSRGNIGSEIMLISTDGRVFGDRFNLNIEANTPPPKPTAVLAKTNAVPPSQQTYVLCLQVPDMGTSVSGGFLHEDIAQIEINGTPYSLRLNFAKTDFIRPTDMHFITSATVQQLTGPGSASVPTGHWVLYYDTGLAVG